MIRCYFCRTAVADVEAAVNADWIPSFYDGEREVSEPVCTSCTSARLQMGEDGEFELAEHTRYADEAESAQRGNAWPQAAALWRRAADFCEDAERKAKYLASAKWCDDMPDISNAPEKERSMTTYLVATVSRYVLVDAASESEARRTGPAALHDLYADLRERLGREVPVEIHTVRPATDDEVRLWNWHQEMVAREAPRP